MSLRRLSDQYRRVKLPGAPPPYKIDIGCGNKIVDGCIGIDVQDNGQGILWDILEGIPLPDNSVDAVYIRHFLEHIEYDALDALFRDIRRVCIPGTIIHIVVPHRQHPCAYAASHVSFWDEKSLEGFTQGFINSRVKRQNIFEVKEMNQVEKGRVLNCEIEVLR